MVILIEHDNCIDLEAPIDVTDEQKKKIINTPRKQVLELDHQTQKWKSKEKRQQIEFSIKWSSLVKTADDFINEKIQEIADKRKELYKKIREEEKKLED